MSCGISPVIIVSSALLFLLVLTSFQLCPFTQAWSPSSSSSSNSRRRFLTKSIASAGGALVTAGGLSTAASIQPANAATFVPPQPHSLDDKVIVITGASSGLGLESAKFLAAGGATVVLTARSENKGAKAVATVQEYVRQQQPEDNNGSSKVFSVLLDLDDLDNVKTFPQRFQRVLGNKKIDVLLNNAGVMAIPDRELTKDGYERTFQSNHLGHFLLTATLLPFLAEPASVINVSSLAYQITGATKGLDLNNLNGEVDFGPWKSYGQSKLENILFTEELQRRADAAGRPLTATSLHPGAVNTDLARYIVGEEKWQRSKETGPVGLWETAVDKVIRATLKTPQDGAATQVYLASTAAIAAANNNNNNNNSETAIQPGQFYSDLKPQKLPAYATDANMAKALWERSEELVGVKFAL